MKLDEFYKPIELQPLDKNNQPNFDLPESLDFDAYFNSLDTLLFNKPVSIKKYLYNNPLENNQKQEKITINPTDIIIVEGTMVSHGKARDYLDYKVFVDADPQKCVERRFKRDLEERGYDKDDVIYKYENHIKDSFKKYILPQKEQANLIVYNSVDVAEYQTMVDTDIRQKALELAVFLKYYTELKKRNKNKQI
ncbi:MAG: hypothetical protein Kapaf2KO_10050 [Candidatus Kapaibacteriales bacterium]